ncbi:hypothetical protein MANI_000736 [Metarhizium anisopliae]
MCPCPYRPLDSVRGEIRLLDIRPAAKYSSPIVCRLRRTYLLKQPKYECLSYVWGKEEGGGDIQLEGTSFRVFENCEKALRRLRNRVTSRTVWIDAICINQADKDEKGAQVLLMQDIYRQAQQVCVWLGEFTDGTILGVKQIQRKLWALGWHAWRVDRKFGKPTLPVREGCKTSITWQNRNDLVTEQVMGEINEILDRPWFSRVWIIQEAILARKLVLMCGPETMAWDRLGTAIGHSWRGAGFMTCFGMRVDPVDEFSDETYQSICHFRERWAAGRWNVSVYQLLYDYRNLRCKWPQDRIYGFLSLTPVARDLGIEPDYHLSPDEVYKSFARTVIEKTLSLDILHCVREWRGQCVSFQERPAIAYSLLEQSRYHDVYAAITDGPEHPPRRGWAKLPPGWERIQEEGKVCYFRNHNDGTDHDTSPLEGGDPIPARYYADQKFLPRGWTKTWNNAGQARVIFLPSLSKVEQQKERLKYLEKHGLDKLPSWVPNWETRTAHDPAPILDWSDPLPQYWTCAKFSSAKVMPATDKNVLGLEGFVFDLVEQMACPWHPKSEIGPISRKGIEELGTWEALAVADVQDCPYVNMGGRQNAHWRTLIADWAGNRAAPEEDSYLIETWYDRIGWQPELPDFTSKGIRETNKLREPLRDMEQQMRGYYDELRSEDPGPDSVSEWVRLPNKYGEYVRRIRRACAHRAMFVTRRGYLGLAPWNAKDSDIVCILKGGKTPYLLRLIPAGSVYQVIGEAYVYGIMGGEAVAEDEQDNDWQVFKIR